MRVESLARSSLLPWLSLGLFQTSVTKKVVYETCASLVGKVDSLIFWVVPNYPLLAPIIQNVMGPEVKLIDSGAECVMGYPVLLNISRLIVKPRWCLYNTVFIRLQIAIVLLRLERNG